MTLSTRLDPPTLIEAARVCVSAPLGEIYPNPQSF